MTIHQHHLEWHYTTKILSFPGLLSRHAVSLAKLPPPIEADTDEKEEFCLPPPPEFGENGPPVAGAESVLAPPPQFSDSRQVTRVRIVGAVTKGTPPLNQGKVKQGRLHSQWWDFFCNISHHIRLGLRYLGLSVIFINTNSIFILPKKNIYIASNIITYFWRNKIKLLSIFSCFMYFYGIYIVSSCIISCKFVNIFFLQVVLFLKKVLWTVFVWFVLYVNCCRYWFYFIYLLMKW